MFKQEDYKELGYGINMEDILNGYGMEMTLFFTPDVL